MHPVQVVLLNRHDTIDAACERLRAASPGARVWFDVPWTSPFGTDLFSLKRLRRVALQGALDLRLTSRRLQTRTLAREAGIRAHSFLPPHVLAHARRSGTHRRIVDTGRRVRRGRRGEPLPLTFGAALGALVVIGVLVAALAGTAAALVPSASLVLEPVAQPVQATFEVTASPYQPDIVYEQAVVPAREIEVVIEGRGEGPTTGTIWVKEKHAEGNVVLVNRTDKPVLVPRATIVRTGSGENIRFYTVAEVELPGTLYGHRRIGIIALEPGEQGNVDALTINIVEGEIAQVVEAINDEPTAGGEDITHYMVKTIDQQRLRESLKEQLVKDAFRELLAEVEEGEFIPQESVIPDRQAIEENQHQVLDEQTDLVSMDMALRVSAMAVDWTSVERLAARMLEVRDGQELELLESSLVVDRPQRVDYDGVQARFQVVARGAVAETIDVDSIQRALRGKEIDQALRWLSEHYALRRPPELSVAPVDWLRMPILPGRINVEIVAGT